MNDTIQIEDMTCRVVRVGTPAELMIYGDFLGRVADTFDGLFERALDDAVRGGRVDIVSRSRVLVRVIEKLRILDAGITVYGDAYGEGHVHAAHQHMPTVDDVAALIRQHLLNPGRVYDVTRDAIEGN